MTSRYEDQYPELFAQLPAERRSSVAAALASDELEHGAPTREQVALVIRSVTDNLSDAEYLAAVLAHVQSK